MKLLLNAFFAVIFVTPLAFAESTEKKCDKKCDKDKQEETLADCGKCEKKKCDKEEEAKKEGTLVAEGKCKKKCDKEEEAEKEATLA
jgi:hypothetical protein